MEESASHTYWKLSGRVSKLISESWLVYLSIPSLHAVDFVRCFPSFYIIIKRLSTHHTNDN